MKNKKLILAITISVVSVILAVISLVVLPQNVITQIGANGQPSSTMPRELAVAVSFALSAGFAWVYFASSDRKYLIASAAGIAVYLFNFIFNLIVF